MQWHLTAAEDDTEKTEPDSSQGFCTAKDKRQGLQVAAQNSGAIKGKKIHYEGGKGLLQQPREVVEYPSLETVKI